MKNKLKGDGNMTTLTLKDIENRVIQNSNQLKQKINRVTAQIQNQNLYKGRLRPKDPTEAKILARFERK